MSQETDQAVLKILTLGNSSVGKTCLLHRIFSNEFQNQSATLGCSLGKKEMEIKGKKVKLLFWDTAGSEQYRGLVKSYYQGGDGFFVTYSVTDRKSFQQIDYWINSIMQQCDNRNLEMVLVGNKCDSSERVVSENEGKELAKQYNILFFETSALYGTNCLEALTSLANRCFDKAVKSGKFVEAAKSNKKVLSSSKKVQKESKWKC